MTASASACCAPVAIPVAQAPARPRLLAAFVGVVSLGILVVGFLFNALL